MPADLPPAISVVMPVYNGAVYLDAAIKSILAQSFRDFELVIIDDGSTDRSLDILQRHARDDTRITIISRPNTGIVGALNEGIAAARGQWIARMDADDIALPERFAAQSGYLSAHPECVAVGCRVTFIDADGALVKSDSKPCTHEAIVAALQAGDGGALIHPSVMFTKSALTKAGGYREQYKYIEDFDLYLRLIQHGKLANLDQNLLSYRLHIQSTNYQRRDSQLSLIEQLRSEVGQQPGMQIQPLESLSRTYPTTASVHREWAFWAMEGGHPTTARKHALRAWLRDPWNRASRSCLAYVMKKEWQRFFGGDQNPL